MCDGSCDPVDGQMNSWVWATTPKFHRIYGWGVWVIYRDIERDFINIHFIQPCPSRTAQYQVQGIRRPVRMRVRRGEMGRAGRTSKMDSPIMRVSREGWKGCRVLAPLEIANTDN